MTVGGRLKTGDLRRGSQDARRRDTTKLEDAMKIWNKPQVREQAVGMEVTAYLPADIDLI